LKKKVIKEVIEKEGKKDEREEIKNN